MSPARTFTSRFNGFAVPTVRRLFERFQNGKRLGVLFILTRWFSMPRAVRIGGAEISLSCPDEIGVINDFLVCAIENDYGLGRGLERPQRILDVGANIGFFSLCARNIYPDAIIHAYEPNPRIVPFLKQNVRKCGVTVFPEALGADAGMVSMVDTGDSNQAMTETTPTGIIPQASFSSALCRIGGKVDLLKLDCEGAEWDLFGATDCWNLIDKVRMEYHLVRSHTLTELQLTLGRLGYKITRCVPHGNGSFGTVWAERAQ